MIDSDATRQLTIDLKEIFKRLDDLETFPVAVTGGSVPAATAQYEHLEADVALAWQPVVNLTLPNDAFLHLGPGPGGSLEYDAGNAHVQATGAPWNVTPDFGIGREPQAKLQIESSRNALADLRNPENYHLIIDNLASDTGEMAALGFFISSQDNDIGAALGFFRTDTHSKGEFRIYNKHSNADLVAPVLSLSVQDDGDTQLEFDLQLVTGKGIIHVDGVAVGPPRQLLLANGTRYVPGTLAADDLPAHDIVGAQHSITGAQWSVVGAPVALNTLGLFTPTDAPGAVESLLKTDASGGIELERLGVGNTFHGHGLVTFEGGQDPISDLNDSADYHLNLWRNSGSLKSVGISFTAGDLSDNIGAAILHNRTGAEDIGTLEFYTKQSVVLGADPALALKLMDDGTIINADSKDANVLAVTKFQVIDTRLAISQDGAANALDIYTYGAAFVPKISFKHARGTRAAPTATQSGDRIGAFAFTGYGATFVDSGGAEISAEAAENQAVGNRGAHLVFSTTPAGSASGFERMRIEDSGNILLASTATLDLNGIADALILDADGDTTLSAPTDDQIDIEIAGADDFTFTANSFNVLTGSLIIMADGTGIGQAAGPLLTFDDSNNFLKITQCDVGIGTLTPSTRLDIDAGAMEFAEMAAPGGGAANTCRIYSVDNGGKTELYAIFNTGAAQLIAAQP